MTSTSALERLAALFPDEDLMPHEVIDRVIDAVLGLRERLRAAQQKEIDTAKRYSECYAALNAELASIRKERS